MTGPQIIVQCPCCCEPAVPVAYDTGDGWAWGIECDECHYQSEGDGTDFEWPFDADTATPADWQAIGVRVV